ncbi:ribosome silencing factor [Pelagibacteraceae bacterium]|nr:ribosome silencing factor [Pelagibacteraceae bacterium]
MKVYHQQKCDKKNKLDHLKNIISDLESNKAENVISMDVSKKTSIANFMVFATGTSNRHVNALSQSIYRNLKKSGFKGASIEGDNSTGWIVLDCGDIVVHIFKKEIREFYNLEKMWSINLESYTE